MHFTGMLTNALNSKHRNPVPALIDGSGITVNSDKRKANILNKYFASVGTVDNGSIPRNIETET